MTSRPDRSLICSAKAREPHLCQDTAHELAVAARSETVRLHAAARCRSPVGWASATSRGPKALKEMGSKISVSSMMRPAVRLRGFKTYSGALSFGHEADWRSVVPRPPKPGTAASPKSSTTSKMGVSARRHYEHVMQDSCQEKQSSTGHFMAQVVRSRDPCQHLAVW